ncbi:MAG: methionyl-tRNA formyltransferase, partial [Candidatus Omnitrophica bacterium]|nr:methionyl-tRNA formyltransferase [Candidatus Omnitrophota bacterium]
SETVAELRSVGADIFVVASYGALLSEEVLALPSKGCINVHPSMLPKYRGASPVVQALLDGETRTGMTIMRMAKALDSGDVILQQQVEIGAEENAAALTDRLSALGGSMTVQVLDLIHAGRSRETPQDHSRATYCSKLKKEDSLLDWNWTADKIHDRVRALSIWPGTATRWKGKLLKVLNLRLADDIPVSAGIALAGQVIEINPANGLRVRTGGGDVWILEVQPEGSRPMGFRDFVNGSGMREGDLLDQ